MGGWCGWIVLVGVTTGRGDGGAAIYGAAAGCCSLMGRCGGAKRCGGLRSCMSRGRGESCSFWWICVLLRVDCQRGEKKGLVLVTGRVALAATYFGRAGWQVAIIVCTWRSGEEPRDDVLSVGGEDATGTGCGRHCMLPLCTFGVCDGKRQR